MVPALLLMNPRAAVPRAVSVREPLVSRTVVPQLKVKLPLESVSASSQNMSPRSDNPRVNLLPAGPANPATLPSPTSGAFAAKYIRQVVLGGGADKSDSFI